MNEHSVDAPIQELHVNITNKDPDLIRQEIQALEAKAVLISIEIKGLRKQLRDVLKREKEARRPIKPKQKQFSFSDIQRCISISQDNSSQAETLKSFDALLKKSKKQYSFEPDVALALMQMEPWSGYYSPIGMVTLGIILQRQKNNSPVSKADLARILEIEEISVAGKLSDLRKKLDDFGMTIFLKNGAYEIGPSK